MSDGLSMVLVNGKEFLEGLKNADKLSLRYMRTEMKRGAQRIRKLFIKEQLQGPPGIKAGPLAKGKNIWTYVQGDTHKTLAGKIGISRILHTHEKGITIRAKGKAGLLFLREKKLGKGKGDITAVVPQVVIPARLKFRQLVRNRAIPELKKVAAAGLRGTEQALQKALKRKL